MQPDRDLGYNWTMSKQRCSAKRYGFKRGKFGTHNCGRLAKGVVETHVGMTEHHPCCGDTGCVRWISGGYPATYRGTGRVKSLSVDAAPDSDPE